MSYLRQCSKTTRLEKGQRAMQHPEAQPAIRKVFYFLQDRNRTFSENWKNGNTYQTMRQGWMNEQSDGSTDRDSEAYDQLMKLDSFTYVRDKEQKCWEKKMRREWMSTWGVKDLCHLTFGVSQLPASSYNYLPFEGQEGPLKSVPVPGGIQQTGIKHSYYSR